MIFDGVLVVDRKGPHARGRHVGGEADDRAVDEITGPEGPVRIDPRVREVEDRRDDVVREDRNGRIEDRHVAAGLGQPELSVGTLDERRRAPHRVGPLDERGVGGIEVGDLEAAQLRDPERSVVVLEQRARRRVRRERPARDGRAVGRQLRDLVVGAGHAPDRAVGIQRQVRAVDVRGVRKRVELGARGEHRDGRRRRRRGRRGGGRRGGLRARAEGGGEEDGGQETDDAGEGVRNCHGAHCTGAGCTTRSGRDRRLKRAIDGRFPFGVAFPGRRRAASIR